MLKRILGRLFSNAERSEDREPPGASILDDEELRRIGTEEDPMRGYEAALERNFEAMEAERLGDVGRAAALYEESVAGDFVGIHPYERLANIHERRGDHLSALRTLEAYIRLAKSGKMPRGAQRSAERKLPEVEDRASRLREQPGD